jgi:hypothetical protein
MTKNNSLIFYIQIIFVLVFIFNTIGTNVSFHIHNDSQSICYLQITPDDMSDIQTPELIYEDSILSTIKNQTSIQKKLIIKHITKNVFQPPRFIV